MLIAVIARLGGISAIWTVWSQLPPEHSRPFTGQYTVAFACMYLISNTLSYNGGHLESSAAIYCHSDRKRCAKGCFTFVRLICDMALSFYFSPCGRRR